MNIKNNKGPNLDTRGTTEEGLVGLFSLFNDISTLFRLFNAKSILLEEQ